MSKKEFLKKVIELMENGKLCCICGAPIEGFGNNPDPVVTLENARCCDACNNDFVIPARILEIYGK